MKRSTIALHAAAAFVLASTCAASAVAGPSNVPFKATLATQEVLRPDPLKCQAFPFLAGTTTGAGHASHLGAVTGIGSDCINPSATGLFSFSNGKLTLVSASGDELRADYSGTLAPTGTGLIYSISGTYRITGGTGRFSTASGSGTLTGFENLTTLQGQLDFAGVLSY